METIDEKASKWLGSDIRRYQSLKTCQWTDDGDAILVLECAWEKRAREVGLMALGEFMQRRQSSTEL
jgi:hypothetical protein